MASKSEHERVQSALTKAITFICQDILQDHLNINIDALIGITLNDKDVILVSIKEAIQSRHVQKDKISAVPSKQLETRKAQRSETAKEEGCAVQVNTNTPLSTTEKSTRPKRVKIQEPINIVPLESEIDAQWSIDISKSDIMQKDIKGNEENSSVEIVPKFVAPPIKTEPDEETNVETQKVQSTSKTLIKSDQRQGTPPVPEKVGISNVNSCLAHLC